MKNESRKSAKKSTGDAPKPVESLLTAVTESSPAAARRSMQTPQLRPKIHMHRYGSADINPLCNGIAALTNPPTSF